MREWRLPIVIDGGRKFSRGKDDEYLWPTGDCFVLYVWARPPRVDMIRTLPFGLGEAALPVPLTSPSPGLAPRAIFKNIPGHEKLLGEATHPSTKAPSSPVDLPALNRVGDFFFQGLILDSNSDQGQLAVTNGVLVISR